MKAASLPAVTRATDLRLLAALAVALAPHVLHLPPWVMLFAAAAVCWRALAILRNWPLPSRTVRFGLCLLAFAGVYFGFGRISGQQAGIALLVLMLMLKLTELRSRRDRVFTLFLAYFLLITQFLFSQSILMAGYLFVAAWLITASLLEISHPQGPLPPRRSLASAAALLGQALPLMAILFILFPRIPGPLWGLPSRAEGAHTGLANHMTPGSIAHLARDNSVAFRVRFAGSMPPPQDRYWRGPVFEHYNGVAWTAGPSITLPAPPVQDSGKGRRYQVILEPSGTRVLPALALPVAGPPNARFTATGEMLARHKVQQRRLYHVRSVLHYRFQPHLSAAVRKRNLALPRHIDPRSRKLVHKWQQQGLEGAALARRILAFFHRQPFYYTLKPPPLSGNNRVDQFLFNTRHGFCEHYASAFTVLMRMAGTPARVVTGYLGGEINQDGNYLIVRQSDAHAWSEIWLAGRGWVRFDPTAAIARQRIQTDAGAPLSGRDTATYNSFGASLLHRLSLRWDWVQATWEQTLLSYGPRLQTAFLSRFGLPDWRSMILALTVLVMGFLSLLGVVLMWQARPRGPRRDGAARAWERFCRKLAKQGLPRARHEGPRDYARRVARARPALSDEVHAIADLYIELHYSGAVDGEKRKRFLRRVREFRAARPYPD